MKTRDLVDLPRPMANGRRQQVHSAVRNHACMPPLQER